MNRLMKQARITRNLWNTHDPVPVSDVQQIPVNKESPQERLQREALERQEDRYKKMVGVP